jgi:manganese/zinc/iron transport system permease protein
MFICPAAAARMLTDRLITQIGVSLGFAALAGIGDYAAAAWAPFWLGSDHSLAASGMVAVATGLILAAAVLFAPRHGVLLRRRRTRVAVRLAPAE